MTLHIEWSMRAANQLQDHVDNLQERASSAVAKRVVLRVFERLDAVAELPESAPRWSAVDDPTFRRLVVDDFVVFYRIEQEKRQIQVLAVRHGRQRPPTPSEVGDP